ncbi:hypothetical protein KRX19_02370 [Cardiobacteriaceae bacterium TAE3-ERU3]|nr:hypothetical protein [Cardiobacteriaceae bacterium TAE3-ERU3]
MKFVSIRKKRTLIMSMVTATVLLSGCATAPKGIIYEKGEAPVLIGTKPRNNITPVESAFSCYANALRANHTPVVSVAVGNVKDYTGKYNQDEGHAITQGGSLMVYSALGKIGYPIQIRERFDPDIAERELGYIDKRQLGDGNQHNLTTAEGRSEGVNWLPYHGGSILKSDYYIVGGITELNYNIQSGGGQVSVSGIGPKARIFTMNIGVDLRLVDTKTLAVVKTSSLQKQITGYETGLGIFRFFGSNLFDINVGERNIEPIQLGVRTTIETSVLELLSGVTGISSYSCIQNAFIPAQQKTTE